MVAVSDNPLNTDDRYSLSLDFVETSRVLEILPSKSTRRKSWRTVRYMLRRKNSVSRLIDMRGMPTEFLSDNWKSFTSPEKELQTWVRDLDEDLLK